jgi:hypothetical protein
MSELPSARDWVTEHGCTCPDYIQESLIKAVELRDRQVRRETLLKAASICEAKGWSVMAIEFEEQAAKLKENAR